ncbi:hypothetical protein J7K19_05765 [bacterium]|nr:hypothetical protein [bacterium]
MSTDAEASSSPSPANPSPMATWMAEYVYALGRIIAILNPNRGYYWVYIDHLKSTRLVDGTDEFQTDMRRDYYPCGEQ